MLKIVSPLVRGVIALIATCAFVVVPVALAGSAQGEKPPHVTLRVSSHSVSTKSTVSFEASTKRPVPGEEVVLQGKRTGAWQEWYTFPHLRGGRIGVKNIAAGTVRLRAVVLDQGAVLDVSNVVVLRVHAPAPVKHTAQATSHSCTRTSSGSCIAGGQFCKQSMYGQIGYDASGRSWRCTGDRTHPHWE